MRKPCQIVILTALAASAAWAQEIISTRSGLIHFIAGNVNLDGEPVVLGNARFPAMAAGQVLEVKDGYVEVLLTPGAFLRLDEGASVRMVANALSDTQLELLSGSALVEIDELLKGNRISVKAGEFQTVLLKNGLYHFDADTDRVKVFDGKVQTSDGGIPVELGRGRSIQFEPGTKPEKFDTKKSQDALYAWSQNRAARMAVANLSASSRWDGDRVRSSFWAWNSRMSMYTFMPGGGIVGSPFGIHWYNPQTVWVALQPPIFATGSGGGQPSGMGQAPVSSGGGAPSAAAGSSGVSRSGGAAVQTTSSGATVTRTGGGHSQ